MFGKDAFIGKNEGALTDRYQVIKVNNKLKSGNRQR